jgi:glycosyltransferase involved in cell wall biosynthesis
VKEKQMTTIFGLSLWLLAALAAYPLGIMLKKVCEPILGFTPSGQPAFFLSFAAIQLLVLVGLGGLSPLRATSSRGVAVAAFAWAMAGHSIWLGFNFLSGTVGALDRTTLVFTGAAQIGLAIVAASFARNPVAAFAFLAGLSVVVFIYPEALSIASATLSDLAPVITFVAANVGTYWLLMSRSIANLHTSPIRYAFEMTRWIIAANFTWLLILFFAGDLQELPRYLPFATGIVEWIAAVAGPLAVLVRAGRVDIDSIINSPTGVVDSNTQIALERGPAGGKRTAWIISYTGVSNEPRVLRQSQALFADGWRIVVCGYDGHSPRPPDWTFVRLPTTDPYRGGVRQLLALCSKIGMLLTVYGRPAPVARWGARLHHLCIPNWMHIRRSVLQLAAANPDLKADLVLCNDYFTCDVGLSLAKLHGAKFAVDCHEYAAEQNAHDANWMKRVRLYVMAVESYYLSRADVISTVCEGIADLLNKDHELKRPVIVVRSVPEKQVQAFRPTGERIKVLYHGGIWHVRQLHAAIKSMPLWRPEFDLILRGDGDISYIAELRRLAHRYGLEGRVFFEGSVPFQRIIPEANKADIGYFSYANFSRQSQFVLPNKFFEYMMSGLALCVIDLAEMGRLVRKHDLGRCIPEHKPEAIAATINGFTRGEIDRYKRNSLKAAEELNWDRERQHMLAAYNELYGEMPVVPMPARIETAKASNAAA